MSVKISVIVAVYNPGKNVEELLESIDEQSLPAGEFEVIFVDDDSTDGSRERLQEWASERPHVRVLHNTPNSGWPGRPRNLGIDAAVGEYLIFADNDDRLAPQGLERMYDYAQETSADVVIPKLVGVGPGRGVPRALFRKNIPDARLGKHPILAILTPHKLVRTSMVREHGIRFPEGRTRLEDHFFIVSCYFAASRIAVYADETCYYWMRRDAGGENASFAPVDPVMYYEAVQRVLEVVEANTEPGPLRDKLYAHWYDGKMLSRLRGGSLLVKTPEYQETLVWEVRRVAERFGLGQAQWSHLGAGGRVRSHLLANGTLAQIQEFGAAERGVTSRVTVGDVAWTDDGDLRITMDAHMTYADGSPIHVDRDGDAAYWRTSDLVDFDLPRIDVSDLLGKTRLDVVSADRQTLDIATLKGRSESVDGDLVRARTVVEIDPDQVFASRTPPAVLDLRSRLTGCGWASEYRIPVPPSLELPPDRSTAAGDVRAYATRKHHKLSVSLQAPDAAQDPETEVPKERGLDQAPTRSLGQRIVGRVKRTGRRVLGSR